MEVSTLNLKNITNDILNLFQNDFSFKNKVKLKDYHGFTKGRIPQEDLGKISNLYGVKPEQLQAELVSVEKDLSDEVHTHKLANAYCIILGEKENFPNTKNALGFIKDKWFEVSSGDVIDIPPNTKHGFTIKPEGILFFLSVQTPPIESKDGHDDYYKVEDVSKPK